MLYPKCVYYLQPRSRVGQRWNENKRDILRMIRCAPRLENAEDLLFGPQLDQLPNNEGVRKRLLHQATIHRKEFISMIQCIMTTKKMEEKQRKATERAYTK